MVRSRPRESETQPQNTREAPLAIGFMVKATVRTVALILKLSARGASCAVTISPPTPIMSIIR